MHKLRDFFAPVTEEKYVNKDFFQTTQIGRTIDLHTLDHFPSLKFSELVIFNVNEYEGSKNTSLDNNCKIRESLYSLHVENSPRISDLGTLKLMPKRQESFKIIEEVCSVLIDNGAIPVIIGGGHDISYAVYKSYVSLKRFTTITVVDKEFDIGMQEDNLASYSYLSKIISHKPSYLFHYNNIGYQSFFVSNIAVEMLENMNFDHVRLGNLKNRFEDIEPLMRDTDFLSFDISSIQHSYAPANVYSSPNGLNGEDACKIARYAGLSDKLTCFGLFEYNPALDQNNQTANLLSQMIWYFIEGYKIRKNELNPNTNNCIKYTVAFDDGHHEIVFFKSKKSGRWWMKVPFKKEKSSKVEFCLIACSYSDYKTAMQGDIPERWIKNYTKLS